MPNHSLAPSNFLLDDGYAGTLVGRAWVPSPIPGPSVIAMRADGVYDLSESFATMSALLDETHPARLVKTANGRRICGLEAILQNTAQENRDVNKPWLLAPCDLQVVKAAGVTFVSSLLERLIEEQARGDASRAVELRSQILDLVGSDLSAVVPGSPRAAQLKLLLQKKHLWSQYLEVGIGPDAEVFTKVPVLAAVGSARGHT